MLPNIFKDHMKATKSAQAIKTVGKNLYMKSTVSNSIDANLNPLLIESQVYAV